MLSWGGYRFGYGNCVRILVLIFFDFASNFASAIWGLIFIGESDDGFLVLPKIFTVFAVGDFGMKIKLIR